MANRKIIHALMG